MRRILITTWLCLMIFINAHAGLSPTPLQIFFSLKQIFPETREIAVFISRDLIDAEKPNIVRAAAQTHLKAVLYPIGDATDIGKNLKQIKDGSTLVVLPTSVLEKKSSKLYILSKCKEKKINLVTSSKDYSDSGALLGVLPGEGHKTNIVLNLKHSQHLQSKFSEAFIQQVGIAHVIQ